MDEWAVGTWIALCALVSTFVLAILGYMRSPPFVPASRLTDMRQTIEALREEVRILRDQVTRLESQIAQKYDENQWLMRQLRNAEDRDLRRDAAALRRDDEIKRRDEK